ncbi:MAG: terminase large subunit [Wendovervirus sonii]|uniref:Terminase large subunit n=1 Tax=phage Lak_Megaphage_Sonny TaxID=3109229 RepID=A0ABZ0Z6K8_9CAUD|nr:MAG: terminase large subunit [phage Lak_Megaphage_Sonny]
MKTKDIENILKKVQEGEAVKNTAFIANTKLRREKIDFEYTGNELDEYEKCKKDPVYFIENYCYIVVNGESQKIKLTDCQKNFLSKSCKHILQDRRSYFTTTLALKNLYDMIFNNEHIGIVSKEDAADELIDKIKFTYQNLPYFLQKGVKHFNKNEIKLEDNSGVSKVTSSNYIGQSYNALYMLNNSNPKHNYVKKVYENIMPCVAATNGKIVTVDDNTEAKAKSLSNDCFIFSSSNN